MIEAVIAQVPASLATFGRRIAAGPGRPGTRSREPPRARAGVDPGVAAVGAPVGAGGTTVIATAADGGVASPEESTAVRDWAPLPKGALGVMENRPSLPTTPVPMTVLPSSSVIVSWAVPLPVLTGW